MRRATGARVEADGLELRTRAGPVYSGVDLSAAPGSLTVLHAEAGSGRTALLLTLAGRMRPTSGTLRVDGHRVPGAARRIRRIAALGLSDGVNDLDERLTVRHHLTERLLLRVRPADQGTRAAALDDAGLGGLDTARPVRDLSASEKVRLGVALALLEEPRLICVDDADAGLGPRAQARFWRTLRALADSGPTVVAACADPAAAEGLADVRPLPPRAAPARTGGRG
ncbi:ABC transporter ATP-binding protein [Nocardiopsis trehalosi]|uniref:ABC transporter ATP-binding protein n=1 Tax=Nocardiopsis trehalosi TaxID=109329 RepID=UPI0009FD5A17|nr:ATP-binding cassette domain-containing protein [Nocardiopsis trehalosi]